MKKLFNLFYLLMIGQIVFSQGVGIGTTTPHAPLQFANLTGNRKIVLWEISNDDHRFYGFGINGGTLRYQISDTLNQHIFYAGVNSTTSNELMRITGRGFVGIGNSIPHAPLHFDNGFANRKIVLSENIDGDHSFYGFGTELFAMRYQVAAPVANHIFYAATSSTSSRELMRITGSGRVGIGTAEPFENLEVGGDGRAFFGDGASENRRGLLIDGIENYNASRIEAFNYANGGSGRNLIINTSGGGNVGIGIITPAQKLHVNGSAVVSDNIGIGISNPHAPLQFSNDPSRKIVLWEYAENDHQYAGFGIDQFALRYSVPSTTGDHVFYAGTSDTTSTDLMHIKGNGNVGIGKSNPTEKLDVAGNVNSSGNVNVGGNVNVSGNVAVTGSLNIGYVRRFSESVSLSAFSSGSATCNCLSGEVAIGGGFLATSSSVTIHRSYANTDSTWHVEAYNSDLSSHSVQAFTICARLAN